MTRTISPLRDLFATARLWRLLRRLRPGILHTHTPKASLLGGLAGWLAGVPVVHSVHGLVHLGRGGLAGFLVRESERISCALARKVICVSPSIRDALVAERLCPAHKAAVSYLGVDAEERFNPRSLPPNTRSRIRTECGIPSDALVLGYCGRIVREKGIVELVEAWRELRSRYPSLFLLAVGPLESEDPVPPGILSTLRSDPRVLLIGEVDDTRRFYTAMDVLVLPSHREGFGLVAAEANAMQLPVIATDIPGCVDAIVAGRTGTLIPRYDPAALVAAAVRYLDDPLLREVHGHSGRLRVLRELRPQEGFDRIYKQYLQVLAQKPADRPKPARGGPFRSSWARLKRAWAPAPLRGGYPHTDSRA